MTWSPAYAPCGKLSALRLESGDETRSENVKLSSRNRLPGRITEVVKGEAAATVGMQVGDNHVVALITRESADELGLEPGKEVMVVVKATDVTILTDIDPS